MRHTYDIIECIKLWVQDTIFRVISHSSKQSEDVGEFYGYYHITLCFRTLDVQPPSYIFRPLTYNF